MTDDTPRDPLTPEERNAILHRHGISGPMTDDMWPGGACVSAYEVAAVLATLDATRPSGDEALRAALRTIRDTTLDQPAAVNMPPEDWYQRLVWQAITTASNALATPSSAPDVEGLEDEQQGEERANPWYRPSGDEELLA